MTRFKKINPFIEESSNISTLNTKITKQVSQKEALKTHTMLSI